MALPSTKIREWLAATQAETLPWVCKENAKNPAFERGLLCTFAYSSTFSEKLGEVYVEKARCKKSGSELANVTRVSSDV